MSITDDEAPIHELGCDDVTGVTDAGQSYGTVGAGSLSLAQHVFIDNSGESDGAGLVYTVHMGQAAVDVSSDFSYINLQPPPSDPLEQPGDRVSIIITTVSWMAPNPSGNYTCFYLTLSISADRAPIQALDPVHLSSCDDAD